MVHDPSLRNETLAIPAELTEKDKADFAEINALPATEEQMRKYVSKTIDVRIRHYEKLCREGKIPDLIKEQMHTKAMQRLVGDMWADMVATATQASINGSVTAPHMLNATLHACAEASIMIISSYAKAYEDTVNVKADTKKIVEAYATTMGRMLLEIGHTNGLL